MTQSCPLHLAIETSSGPVRFTTPFIVLPEGGDVVIIGQQTLREKLGIDVMAQLKASVLKAHGLEDGPEIEITAGAVGEHNAGAVLRGAMAVTAFGPRGDAPGDADDDVTLTLLSQRSMMFQDSEVEMQDRVGALETAVDDAVDDAVDHDVPPECGKTLRDIVFRTHLDVFRRALLGDPPARVEPMTVWTPGELGGSVANMAHELLGYLSGPFIGVRRSNGQLWTRGLRDRDHVNAAIIPSLGWRGDSL